jgi:hypothetical protein
MLCDQERKVFHAKLCGGLVEVSGRKSHSATEKENLFDADEVQFRFLVQN